MPELVVDNQGLRLSSKARHTLLEALRFQIAAWNAKTVDELGEDAYADLQNDLAYAEILLSSLEDQFAKM